jgi:hypothetical protein
VPAGARVVHAGALARVARERPAVPRGRASTIALAVASCLAKRALGLTQRASGCLAMVGRVGDHLARRTLTREPEEAQQMRKGRPRQSDGNLRRQPLCD